MTETPTLWCASCGASTRVVTKRSHEQGCRAGAPVVWTTVNPHQPTKPASVTHKPVIHTSVTHNITPRVTHAPPVAANQSPQPATRSKAAERQARYRAKHGDAYKQRHRDLMRQKRATENTATTAA